MNVVLRLTFGVLCLLVLAVAGIQFAWALSDDGEFGYSWSSVVLAVLCYIAFRLTPAKD